MLERSVGEQLDDRALELADARSNILCDEPDDLFREGHLEMIDRRLLTQNRNPVFEVGRFDVRNHSPLESTHQAGFQSRNLRRRAIAGQHDLTASLVESVEGVKELILGRFLTLQEVNVVHEEQVGFAKSATKISRRPVW